MNLPKSTYHHTNGTWWGPNKIKVVRHQDKVYTYFVDNKNLENGDPNMTNPSKVHILRINKDLSYETIDTLYSSRTPSLAIDSSGNLLVCNFEPTSNKDNGSIGKLELYTYTFDGERMTRSSETVAKSKEDEISINMRFSMAIDENDNIVIGNGLNCFEDNVLNHTLTVYYRKKGTREWITKRLGEHLGEDNYYPYMLINGVDDIRALAIQDECRPETQFDYPCFYQYVSYFAFDEHEKIVDYSDHKLASTRPQLMDHLSFYLDESGDIHILTKARLDEEKPFKGTFDYISESTSMDTSFIDPDFNWLRFFEYQNKLYLVGVTYDKLGIINLSNEKTYWLDIPKNDIFGSYIFTNDPKGGSDTSEYLDIYLVPADKNSYDHDALYLRLRLESIIQKLK